MHFSFARCSNYSALTAALLAAAPWLLSRISFSYKPSGADSALLTSINASVDAKKYAHVARWLKQITSFAPEVRATWAGAAAAAAKPAAAAAAAAPAKPAAKKADSDDDGFDMSSEDDEETLAIIAKKAAEKAEKVRKKQLRQLCMGAADVALPCDSFLCARRWATVRCFLPECLGAVSHPFSCMSVCVCGYRPL